jgi:hypothetical protein
MSMLHHTTDVMSIARAVLLWQLRRKVASAIFRANLNCLRDLMTHIRDKGNWAGSTQRKAEARRRFFAHGDAANASYQYRAAHSNFPRDSRDAFY